MSFPYEWQPTIVPIQLAMWGSDLAVAAVPGEFTTMSGRRMRKTVSQAIREAGGAANTDVIIAGLSNLYSDYITTPEEYQVIGFSYFTLFFVQSCANLITFCRRYHVTGC